MYIEICNFFPCVFLAGWKKCQRLQKPAAICKRFDWWKHLYYVQKDTRNPPTDPLNLDLNSVESLWYQTWSVTSRLAQRKDSHSFRGSLWAQKHSRIDKLRWVPYLFPSHPVDFSPKQLSFQVHWLELLHDCALILVNFNSLHFLLHKDWHQNILTKRSVSKIWLCLGVLGDLDRSRGLGTGSCGPAGGVGPAVCGGAVSSGSATRTGAASWHHRRQKHATKVSFPKLFQSLDFRRRHLHNCAGHQHLSRQDTCLLCVWQTYLLTSMKIKGFPVYHTAAEIISKQWWRQEHLCRHEGMPWCRSTCGSEKKKKQLAYKAFISATPIFWWFDKFDPQNSPKKG